METCQVLLEQHFSANKQCERQNFSYGFSHIFTCGTGCYMDKLLSCVICVLVTCSKQTPRSCWLMNGEVKKRSSKNTMYLLQVLCFSCLPHQYDHNQNSTEVCIRFPVWNIADDLSQREEVFNQFGMLCFIVLSGSVVQSLPHWLWSM